MIGAFFIILFTVFVCFVAGLVVYVINGARKLKPGEYPSKIWIEVFVSLEATAILIVMFPLILLGIWIFMKVWWLGIIVIVSSLFLRKIVPIDDIISCRLDPDKFNCELSALLFSKHKPNEENPIVDDLDTNTNILKDYIEDSGLVHVQRVENPHTNNTGSFRPTTMSKAFMASQRAASIIKNSSESI